MRSVMPNFDFSFDGEKCAECHAKCCRGESGSVWLNSDELREIAALLNDQIEVVKACYTKQEREGMRLREYNNGQEFFCVFLDRSSFQCTIYNARPKQCRTFPFWEHLTLRQAYIECVGVSAI